MPAEAWGLKETRYTHGPGCIDSKFDAAGTAAGCCCGRPAVGRRQLGQHGAGAQQAKAAPPELADSGLQPLRQPIILQSIGRPSSMYVLLMADSCASC